MKKIKFIVPFPDTPYYLWQVLVQINNFRKFGYEVDTYYLVCYFNNRVSDVAKKIAASDNIKSTFRFYPDERTDLTYTASIKPWLMAKFFEEYPEEKENIFIYLDPDLIFLKPIDWIKYSHDDIWYESDTSSYLNSIYIKSKGEQLFNDMCDIVEISPDLVIANDYNCGGAQYVTKNNTCSFWYEVSELSTVLYKYMVDTAKNYQPEGQTYPIQAWTSEMWVTNWIHWRNGGKTRTVKELNFHWANHSIKYLEHDMYHNAGVTINDGEHFCKIAYQVSPFNKETLGKENSISYNYIKEIRETELNFPELLF